MVVVMVIPTGLGCAIGGDAGDATPAAKLLASCCDTLVIHPNVVNASDINEMTDNMMYVAGPLLDCFMAGTVTLQRSVRPPRILLVANPPFPAATYNAASAARATIGADITLLELKVPIIMKALTASRIDGIQADGSLEGVVEAIEQIRHHDFDVLAVHTPIECDRDVAMKYFSSGGVNPWGGVEAKLTKALFAGLGCNVAHAPIESTGPDDPGLFYIYSTRMRPRTAAEGLSIAYLHCVLKGLHHAPLHSEEEVRGVAAWDVEYLVSPMYCWGTPHSRAQTQHIPIIFVRDNDCSVRNPNWENALAQCPEAVLVENYLEAAGVIMAGRAGVTTASVLSRLKDNEFSVGDSDVR